MAEETGIVITETTSAGRSRTIVVPGMQNYVDATGLNEDTGYSVSAYYTDPDGKTIYTDVSVTFRTTRQYSGPLCFTAAAPNSWVRFNHTNNTSFLISKDGTYWYSYTKNDTINLNNVGDKVYFVGNNNTRAVSGDNGRRFYMGGQIAASGDVTSLLNRNGNVLDISSIESCFSELFLGCGSLTTAPELPSTTLSYECYRSLFNSCTSLVTPPRLPATNLAVSCYSDIFSNCSSLTTSPDLPATTLQIGCYQSMFRECKKLVTPPAMPPVTVLPDSSLIYMFLNCSSLETPPDLSSVVTINSHTLRSAFENCVALKTPPDLASAVSVGYYGCCDMCKGCISLEETSDLRNIVSSTTASITGMFYNCKNIDTAYGPANNIDSMYMGSWIEGCASTGTVYVNKGCARNYPSGDTSIIPAGWTLVEID